MARQTRPLTNIEVKTAIPKEKKYKLFDGDGLFLLVKPTGSKLWRLKYRFERKEKEYAIGSYPTYSLAKAREERTRLRMMLIDGIDPNVVRKQTKQETKADIVQDKFDAKIQLHLVVEEWLELHDKKVTDYTARKTRALLENSLLPRFGELTPRGNVKSSIPIGEIKHYEITDLLKEKAKETEYTPRDLNSF